MSVQTFSSKLAVEWKGRETSRSMSTLSFGLPGGEQSSVTQKSALKVARAIADLDGADGVKRIHIAEALVYRRVDPNPAQAISTPSFQRP